MRIGASYYPEAVSERRWRDDLETARNLGLDCLRCGEFAWSAFDPDGNHWEPQWALRFLDLAYEMGLGVIWCTPSATPPPWVFDRWSDLAALDHTGRAMPVGVRRHYCPSHEGYRRLCAQTATRLASELGAHPAILGWQVDNELAGDGFTCWCDGCGRAFQQWLAARYVSLDNLNARWQTAVWSQSYSAWSQIPVPREAFGAHTPSLKLAYRRFRSENWLAFLEIQADAIRRQGGRNVTTNWFNYNWDLPADQWAWRPRLDAVGVSHYLHEEAGGNFQLALLRGLGDKPLWVLEQRAGDCLAQNLCPEDLSRIGAHLRRCREHGAQYGIYWHLLQHAAGCEAEHGAVLRHDGRPTRIAEAIAQAIADTAPVAPATPRPDVTILYGFEQHWAQQYRPGIPSRFNYTDELAAWHAAARVVWGDVPVAPLHALAQRSGLAIMPLWQMSQPTLLPAVKAFLACGGTVLTTGDWGRLDEENNVLRRAPLAILSDLGAPEVDVEWFQLRSDAPLEGRLAPAHFAGRYFWLVPRQPLAPPWQAWGTLALGGISGPAAISTSAGGGRLVVLLAEPDAAGMDAILRHEAKVSGIVPKTK